MLFLNKYCEYIPGKDKGCHFIAGALIFIGVYLLAAYLGNDQFYASVWGIGITIVIGLLKEFWDEYSYGGGDYFDFYATIIGGTFSFFITMFILDVIMA